MSRFDFDYYQEDFPNQSQLWWANIERALKGRKGQKALRELKDALLALPEKKLISGRLADENENVCAVGAFALAKRMAAGESRGDILKELAEMIVEGDYDDGSDITASLGERLGLTYSLAWRFACLNDEDLSGFSPELRYDGVLEWIDKQLVQDHAGN